MAYSDVGAIAAAGDLVTLAWLNGIRSNQEFFNSVLTNWNYVLYNHTSNYSISGAFADVDATNLKIDITTLGGDVYVGVMVSGQPGSGGYLYLDIYDVTSTARIGSASTKGLARLEDATNPETVFLLGRVTGLSAGTHTFKLQAYAVTASGTIYATTSENPVVLMAWES